jgi:hypothetical protein
LADTVGGENEFDGFFDGAGGVAHGDVGKGVYWEVFMYLTATRLDEGFPHGTGRGVIGEREVDGSVEELLKVLFRTVVGFTGASDNSYPRLISNPLILPLNQCLLYPIRIIILLP